MGERLWGLLAEMRWRFEAQYGPRLVGLVLYGSQARGVRSPDPISTCSWC